MISSIVHIAHEYDDDNEPWTIEIEDHDGNLHSVALEEGQVGSHNLNILLASHREFLPACLLAWLFTWLLGDFSD